MKKRTIICVWALLCLNFAGYAQEPKALNIGQKIPAIIYNQKFPVLNATTFRVDSLSLSQFKGKLTLLDFWASWCTNCIYKFDLIGQLQRKYQGQFQVLLVNAKNTKDTPERMSDILTGKNASFIKTDLTTIYNDSILNKLFPHSFLPHYVWIGSKGELLALTGAELVNENTITQYLTHIVKQDQKAQVELNKKP